MSITVGTSEISNVYIGTTAAKEVYVGTTKVRPVTVDALGFKANTANSSISLNKYRSPTSVNIEYSTNGSTWSDYTFGTSISLSSVGSKVYFRNKSSSATGFSLNEYHYYYFSMGGSISAIGSVGYLLSNNNATTTSDYCFYKLFYQCTALTTCPSFPANGTLADSCYMQMFSGCYNLETLPKLNGTYLYNYVGLSMFENCSKIKISSSYSGEYTTAYGVPYEGSASGGSYALLNMFSGTGGSYTGTIQMNRTYYTSNALV